MSSYIHNSKNSIFTIMNTSTNTKMEEENQEYVIADMPVPETSTDHSITALLNYCKTKIINPYLRMLSVMGLRPLINCQEERIAINCFNYGYLLHAILLMIIGYILQYMTCFRRDRGFCFISSNIMIPKTEQTVQDQICHGSVIFSFILPSVLHLTAYLHAIYSFRTSDDEQLSILMERVFIASSNLSNGFCIQRKLVKTLWIFIFMTLIWMVLSVFSVNFMMHAANIDFAWISRKSYTWRTVLKMILMVCTLWQDAVVAIIISNYCMQAQLLTSYLHFLKERLLQHSTEPVEWMREIENFKKMLAYLNDQVSISVCIFTIVNLSCTISGTLWLFDFDQIDRKTITILVINVLNIILWLSISIAPFLQAARLTNACQILKNVGQEVRIRPFVHISTPGYELDSILLYTSSLHIGAKLFNLTINGQYLCFFTTVAAICILVLGQCHYFT